MLVTLFSLLDLRLLDFVRHLRLKMLTNLFQHSGLMHLNLSKLLMPLSNLMLAW